MKKRYLLLALIITLSTLTFGCDKKEEKNETNTTTTTQKQEQQVKDEPSLYGFTINGKTIKLGDKFEDVKDKLGSETKPAENVKPCGIELHGETKRYYYNDVIIETNYQGIIYYMAISKFETPNTKAEVKGMKLKTTVAEAKTITSSETIENDSEYGFSYKKDQKTVSITLTDDNDIGFISMEDKSIEL